MRYNVLKDPKAAVELYDLSTDVGETQNVAAEHPEIVTALSQIMQDARMPSEIFTFEQKGFLQDN